MPTTDLGLPYPAGSTPFDPAGDLYALAIAFQNLPPVKTTNWISYNTFDLAGPASGGFAKVGRYRYRAGRILFQGNVTLNGAVSSALILQLPVSIDTGPAGGQMIGKVTAKNTSESSQPYDLSWDAPDANHIRFNAVTGDDNHPGRQGNAFGNAPFNEAWVAGDTLYWQLEYDPAS